MGTMAHRRRPLPRGLGDRILRVFLAVSLTVPQITIPFVAHAENEAKSTTRDYSKLDIPVSDEKWKTRLKFLEARYDEAVRNVHVGMTRSEFNLAMQEVQQSTRRKHSRRSEAYQRNHQVNLLPPVARICNSEVCSGFCCGAPSDQVPTGSSARGWRKIFVKWLPVR